MFVIGLFYSGKEIEQKTGKEKAEARWKVKGYNKSEEPESQHSALWEEIISRNKSLLVISEFTHSCLCIQIPTRNDLFFFFLPELLCKKLLQYALIGSVCCLCNQLHPPLLQGENYFK